MIRRIIASLGFILCCASGAMGQSRCLTTVFDHDWYGTGNMFDIEPLRDLHLTRWQVNTSSLESVTIEVYWREGSYQGFENDPSAWTLLGRATTQGQGIDYPTSLYVGTLPVYEGQTYGIYVHLASHTSGGKLEWQRGSGVFENDDLRLTTGIGLRSGAFEGTPESGWTWCGAVCYEDARPFLAINGACPGTIELKWKDAEPNRAGGICYGDEPGIFVLPQGPCGGTVMGISGHIRLVRSFHSGPDGAGRVVGRAIEPFCGGYIQLIFIGAPCQISNLARLPE